MKKRVLTFVLLALLIQQTKGRNLNAFFSYCTFDQPGNSSYIETYLNVVGTSVNLVKNSENKFQGKIEVQWVYKQNEKIVYFNKYNLLSPSLTDLSQAIPDFIDQQRVALHGGDYILELKITDKNSTEQSYITTQNISINYPSKKINISDIELLESYTPSVKAGTFTKSGYDVVPFVYNYFPKTKESLKFYTEIYNTKDVLGDDYFLVTYNIAGHQNKSIINNLGNSKKQKASSITGILAELPIHDVSSGNYNLSIEVRDKSNNLLASKQLLFQRSNPSEKSMNPDDLSVIKIDNTFVSYMTDKEVLTDYISSLYPISEHNEADIEDAQLQYNNIESMQQFFYYFWSKRNSNDPEQAWLDYQAEVNSVNATFACPGRKGYDSDRGRVYLQYGKPNSIDKEYFEGDVYPYEIWQYNTYKDQRNIKFVFFARDLSSNCQMLIHSTAKGEIYDSNWQAHLSESKSRQTLQDIDYGDEYNHREIKGGNIERPIDAFDRPK